MAINKRFAHLNHSGSNHSILDAESAYITGTLQVGGVGVFGGDLHISGNLTIDGSYPSGGGGTSFLYSETAGVMQQSGSLYLTGSARFSNLSASNGAEVTGSVNVIGSVLVDLTQGPNQTFIISGSYGQSSLPYLEIVDSAIPLATYSLFTVAGLGASSKGVTVNSNEPIIYARIDPFAAAIAGADLRVVSGSNAVELYSNFIGVNPAIKFTPTSSSPTGFIVVNDDLSAPADLDLAIRALKINNDAGTSGYVLTSQGAGTSPIWAAASGGGSSPEYWFSTGSNEAYTTGSVLIRAGLAASPTPSIVEFDVSGSEITTKKGSYRGSAVRVKDVAVAASDWDFPSGSLYVMAANVGASGSGGDVNIEAGNAGWDDVNAQAGGWVNLLAGNGANTLQSYNGGFISIEAGSPGWSGGAFNAGEEGKAGDIQILGGAISPVSRSLSGSNFLMASFRSFKINDDLNNLDSSTDVFFFASGSIGAKGTSDRGVAVFGGDLHVSGGLTVDYPAIFATGLTGSLTEVSAGVPYLLAGDNIILVTNSLGQVAISASIPASGPQWYYSNVDEIATSGSAAVTGSLAVTGAAYFSPAGTGRGLLNFGGLDIGPITGSMTVTSAEQSGAVLSGSLLSASNGVAAESVLRHEFHILGFGIDGSSNSNIFAATYLVMSYVNTGGVQTAIAVTEISREASGSYATGSWDVNVSSDCNIEVTGGVGGNVVRWYGQRIKEMSLNSAGGIT